MATATSVPSAQQTDAEASATGLVNQSSNGATINFGFGGGSTPTNAPSAPASAAQGPISPDVSSVSPWFLGQIGGYQVQLGGGLAGGGAMTINQAIQWFQNLPQAQLVQIQNMLWAGGYYTDGNGNPLNTAPAFGGHDNQSFRAFLNAVIQSYDTNTSFTNVVSNAIESGQGANNRSNLPSAVTGGGNVYNIDLTNPEDVRYTAQSIFQAALGRNPTDDELARITSSLQNQETSQGLLQEQGSEASSREKYNTSVNQRNIAYQFATTPKVALGAVPNGPVANTSQWAVQLLQYMGMPVTTSNVQFISGWANKTGQGLQNNNPLGVQNAVPGSTPNSKGVPAYTSTAQGLQATVQTLESGSYSNILAALQSGDALHQMKTSQVGDEFQKFSNGRYSSVSAGDEGEASQAVASVTKTPLAGQEMVGHRMAGDENQAPEPQTGVQVSTTTTSPSSVTSAADVNQTQMQSNPGDQYIGPVTTYSTNPATDAAAAYNEATTGANRIAFGANNYLNAFNAAMQMIKSGGPTG